MDWIKRLGPPLGAAMATWSVAAVLGLTRTNEPTGWTYVEATGWRGLFQATLYSLAIAIIVATVIAELVERAHKKRMEEEREIANKHSFVSMFRRAFGSFFSDELLQEAIDSLFSKSIMRNRFDIEYTFKRHPKSNRLLLLEIIVDYTVENISELTQSFHPKLMMPNLMADHKNDPLRSSPVLLSASVNDVPLSESQVDAANKTVNIDNRHTIIPLGEFQLAPKQKMKISTESRLIKASSGAETMRHYFPTKNVHVKVRNTCEKLIIDIMGNGSKAFPEKRYTTHDKTRWIWETTHLMLPENGWVLYWNDTSENISGLSSVDSAREV
jgi:hypothetical protein